jgi:hypothetical protein
MILALGARGPEFDSRNAPFFKKFFFSLVPNLAHLSVYIFFSFSFPNAPGSPIGPMPSCLRTTKDTVPRFTPRPCCDLLSKAQHDERIPKRGPHRQHSEIATTGHHGKLAIATDCSLKCSTSVSADEDGGPHRQHSEITSTGHHGSSSATPPLQPSCVFSRQWKQP